MSDSGREASTGAWSKPAPPERRSFGAFALVLVIAAIGALWVALSRSSAEPIRSPSAWVSADTAKWVQVPLEREDDHRLIGVAASENAALAIGTGSDGGTIWTSTNGQDWSCTWEDPDFEPGGVLAGGPGWIVVGGSWEAAVYTSPDGETWDRTYKEADSAMTSVADLGSTVVVGGGSWAGGNETVATVWASTDGEEWTDVALPGGDGTQVIALEPYASGVLAVADKGTIWRSEDGFDWAQIETAGFDPMAVTSVAATNWMLAVGWDWEGDAALWLSEDGIEWRRARPPEDWEPHGAATVGDEILALGQIGNCQASVLSVAADGSTTELSDQPWLSNECRDGVPVDEDYCEPTSARTSAAAELNDGSVIVVGHW